MVPETIARQRHTLHQSPIVTTAMWVVSFSWCAGQSGLGAPARVRINWMRNWMSQNQLLSSFSLLFGVNDAITVRLTSASS